MSSEVEKVIQNNNMFLLRLALDQSVVKKRRKANFVGYFNIQNRRHENKTAKKEMQCRSDQTNNKI